MGSRSFSVAPIAYFCDHKVNRFLSRCEDCEEKAEVERQAERARVQGPAWVIEQAVKRQLRWFDGCAFCPRSPDLVVHTIHAPECPFMTALAAARNGYGLHLVALSEGRPLPIGDGPKP